LCPRHHGLEWITSLLLTTFIFDCGDCIIAKERLEGIDISKLLGNSSIYIVPMVNPDGVEIVHNGNEIWQANAQGIDLNHNYPAKWDECRQLEIKSGINAPGPTRFGGDYPAQAPEVQAVMDFTRKHNLKRAVALHSQGEEIYWNFAGLEPPTAFYFAKLLSNISGYAVATPPEIASCGGFKDWFIEEYRCEGYTIEVGLGKNPLPLSQYSKIYKDILAMLLICAM
jgi:g-D-glutamyl-meso-diaminopimelate peptidase